MSKTLNDIVNDGEANEAVHVFGIALLEIAQMATDTTLTEANLFLRARKLAQEACRDYDLDFVDSTFGGKSSP